jgi:hypothetical protein
VPREHLVVPILIGAVTNARWCLDFVHDQFSCGRLFRILNTVEDVTRELTVLIQRRCKPGFGQTL